MNCLRFGSYTSCFIVMVAFLTMQSTSSVIGMVAVTNDTKVLLRTDISKDNPQGKTWKAVDSTLSKVPGVLQQVAFNEKGVTWALTQDGVIYVATTPTAEWKKIDGIIAQTIVVNNTYQVFSLDKNGNCFVRTNTSQANPAGDTWKGLETGISLKSISVSANHMWALDSDGNPYYRADFNIKKPEGTTWTRVSGTSFSTVCVNDNGHLWALKKNGDIYFRARISKNNPAGTAWRKVSGNAQSLSLLSDGTVYMVDKNGSFFARKSIEQGNPLGDRWQETKVPAWLNNQYSDQKTYVVRSYGVFSSSKDVYNSYAVFQRQDQYLNMYKHHYFSREGVDISKNIIGNDWSDKPYGLGCASQNGRFMITESKAMFIDTTGKSQDFDLPAALSNGSQASDIFSFLTNEDGSLLFCFQQIADQPTKLYARQGITPQTPMGTSWNLISFDGLGQGNITLFQNTLEIGDGHIWGLVYDQDAQKQILVRRSGFTADNPYGDNWVQISTPGQLSIVSSQIALIDGGVLVTNTRNPGDKPTPGVWFKPLMQPDSDGGDFVEMFSMPFDESTYDKTGQHAVFVSTSLDGTIIVGRSFSQKGIDGQFIPDYLWWSATALNTLDPKKTIWSPLLSVQKSMWSVMISPNSTIWGIVGMTAYTRTSLVPAYAPGAWVSVDKPQNASVIGSSNITLMQQMISVASTI